MKLRLAFLVPILFSFSACSGISIEDCVEADWGELGYKYGLRGGKYTSEALAPYNKACAKGDITPDADIFESSRAEGAREYCRVDNGFDVGRRGVNYNNVCDADLEAAFLDEYEKGRELYAYESAVDEVNEKIKELEDDQKDETNSLAALKEKLAYNSDISAEERDKASKRYHETKERLSIIREKLNRLTYEKVQKEKSLQDFKSYKGYH